MFAQVGTISGIVTDNHDRHIHLAKVLLSGTDQFVLTDSVGHFYIRAVPLGEAVISASHLGYVTTVIKAKIASGHTKINIKLNTQNHHLAEVWVKDRHVEERKETESLNVETVNQDFIQRNLGGSLMATLSRLPGIKTIGIGSGQSKPLIRGLGFNRVVVVDKGVKHEGQQWGADHGLELDQFAAGEVELIKGAASFVYGSDAIGGAIDVKPAPLPAPHTLGGSVDLIGKTNNNLYGTSANFYGRKQQWFFDSRITYQNYGDYRVPTDQVQVYNYTVKLHQNYLRNTAGRETGVHFNTGFVGQRFRSVFYLSNVYSNSGFFANAHGLEPRNVPADVYDASSRDIMMPSQRVNHFKLVNRSSYHTGRHHLEAELGYQRNYRQEFSQYVNHGYMPPVFPDTMRIPAGLERQFDKTVYSINARDVLTFGAHALTIGFNAEHQDNTIDGWTFLVPAFKQTTVGGFVYDKIRFNDRLLLHSALRYDYGRIRMFKYTDWFSSRTILNGDTALQKLVRADNLHRHFNSVVWSVGANYNTGQFSLKANAGKSFRMPIAKELGANGVNYHYFSYERGNPTLSPEQSYQVDLSLGWKANKWFVQLSPFYNYFPNYIYLNPTAEHDYFYGAGNQVFQYAQSRVMRYGGELQFKYQLLKNISTELLGEYLYAEQLSGEKKGYTLPFSPPASALINLTWTPQIAPSFKNTYLSVDYRITAAQNNIVPPEKVSPGYRVINLQAGTTFNIHQQPVMVSLQAQNLLNTRYLNHTSFYRLIELPEAGRNIILSLKLPFTIGNHANYPSN